MALTHPPPSFSGHSESLCFTYCINIFVFEEERPKIDDFEEEKNW